MQGLIGRDALDHRPVDFDDSGVGRFQVKPSILEFLDFSGKAVGIDKQHGIRFENAGNCDAREAEPSKMTKDHKVCPGRLPYASLAASRRSQRRIRTPQLTVSRNGPTESDCRRTAKLRDRGSLRQLQTQLLKPVVPPWAGATLLLPGRGSSRSCHAIIFNLSLVSASPWESVRSWHGTQ